LNINDKYIYESISMKTEMSENAAGSASCVPSMGDKMPGFYKILSEGNARQDEASILDVLCAIKNGRLTNDLGLLNFYREVPINFGATVNQVERGMAEFEVHQLQALLMEQQRETIIRSGHLQHDVVARVLRADVDKGFAFLTQFSYVQILTDRRAHVRVRVSGEIEVTFRVNQLQLQGRLRDISIGGLAIMAPEMGWVHENIRGEIIFFLSGARLSFPATLLRMADAPPQKIFAFQCKPDGNSEKLIANLVFQTQSEIIRELKEKIF